MTLAKSYGTTMGTQPCKANSSQKPGSTVGRTPANKPLGVQFFRVVAFAVSCKPRDMRLADHHLADSKNSMNGACRFPDSVGQSAPEVPGNANATA
jgi:hypothetical protein